MTHLFHTNEESAKIFFDILKDQTLDYSNITVVIAAAFEISVAYLLQTSKFYLGHVKY